MNLYKFIHSDVMLVSGSIDQDVLGNIKGFFWM